MESYRSSDPGQDRLVIPAIDAAKNGPSRLPTRFGTKSSQSSTPIASTSRLTKRRPSTGKTSTEKVSSASSIARPEVQGGIRRLVGQDLRRELELSAATPPLTSRNVQYSMSHSRRQGTPGVSEPVRTPSLVSGSSASTMDSPHSARLRRKRSNVGRQDVRSSSEPAFIQNGKDDPGSDPKEDAVFGIVPPVTSTYASKDHHDEIINLDRYVFAYTDLATTDLPPPTPLYALSSTPSTGYSPGPFSISSTPTSMTSVSPSLASSTASRTKQTSPYRSRPPVVRVLTDGTTTSLKGLPSVRESSSSSTSTLRDGDRSKDQPRVFPLQALSQKQPMQKPGIYHHRKSSSGARSASDGNTNAANKQIPPEFAHLVDPVPRKSSITGGGIPPPRPSRDGAPEMILPEQFSVVQSNMSSLPVSLHKRQSSSDSRRTGAPLIVDPSRSRFGISRTRTVSPSPSHSSALSPLTATSVTRNFTPDISSEGEASTKTKPSPNVESKPFGRFGFFSKKSKVDELAINAQTDRKIRKGPSAGTGHEAYGRFTHRGRSGSTTSGSGSTSLGRSPSSDSITGAAVPSSRKTSIGSKSGSDFEDFLAEREKPIKIRGGRNVPPTVESNNESTSKSSTSGASLGPLKLVKRPTLLPSPMSDAIRTKSPTKEKKYTSTPKSAQNSVPISPSLTTRRLSQRSFIGGKALASLPQNDELPTADRSVVDKVKETIPISASSEDDVMMSTGAGVPPAQQSFLKPPSKWKFLQRAKSPIRKELVTEAVETTTHNQQTSYRSIAHYAMSGASASIDADELEKIMQEAESGPEGASSSEAENAAVRRRGKSARRGDSILLPPPPKFVPKFVASERPVSPRVTLKSPSDNNPAPQGSKSPSSISIVGQPRPSRLPQVGRIPRVVSKRDRERKISDDSFSRPFHPSQPSPALKHGPLPPIPMQQAPELVKDRSNIGGLSDFALVSASQGEQTSPSKSTGSPRSELRLFSSRKGSEQSSSSSSSGFLSLMATTAIIPTPDAPFSDDEIWSEYDDVLEMLSGKVPKTPKTPKTPMTGSSLGAPFHYADFSPDTDAATAESALVLAQSPFVDLSQVTKVPTMASIAHQIRIPSMHDSRIMPYMALNTPRSPFRLSQWVAGYGERNLSVIDPVSGRLSIPSTRRQSTATSSRYSLPANMRPQSSQHDTHGASPATRHSHSKSNSSSRDSGNMAQAETAYMGFENLANLRLSALMTSKWLSFGRVIFSPAHTELTARGQNRVLVLDGLGKDWSFWVALNYPNASIYNLGAEPADISGRPETAAPLPSMSNHRHIHHPSIGAPFPFPKGFFAAVIFRYPLVTSEAAYKSAIFECKRVLRPGGYLEISVLDMDMMNMGSRARSALRTLKMQMSAEDPNISLKPLSDTIQRLIGRHGFENLNRCYVGVPCAGRVPGSRDESGEEPSSASASAGSSQRRMVEDLPSFNDLMRAQDQSSDEGITQMVSRVGRWWYSRCYESLVLPEGDLSKSIWNDDALIRESEKRNTSLKLMVCYCQKPTIVPRRTLSC